MSFPAGWITCHRCSAEYSTDVLAGRYVYELPDGTQIPIERKYGWCCSCTTLVPVEDLEPLGLSAERASLETELRAHTGLLASLSSHHKGHADRINKRLAQVKRLQGMLANRASPSRCLGCGSTDLLPVPENLLQWSHPGCGGRFAAQETSAFFSVVYPLRVYSPEGQLVREVEDDW